MRKEFHNGIQSFFALVSSVDYITTIVLKALVVITSFEDEQT